MEEKQSPSLSELYRKGKENLEKVGSTRWLPPDSNYGFSLIAGRKYLDSLFFLTKFLDPKPVDTSLKIFGVNLRTPVYCSPISAGDYISDDGLIEVAKGVGKVGALMMLGIGGSAVLQRAIDTGAPMVKIVKPYRNTELIYEKVRDAESRGCVAVGMDIDHFYGSLRGTRVVMNELFGPQTIAEIKSLIAQTKLPFLIKGVLSIDDALKTLDLGASAIVVSNHGRSSIDFSLPSIMALGEIAEIVGKKMIVLVDTGFKTGNDVLKALALGAKAVGFGSSFVIARAADGVAGVELLVNSITAELHRTMAATGCANLASISKSVVRHVPCV